MIKYTPEMIDWLTKNVKGRHYKDLTVLFNQQFNLNVSLTALRSALKRYKLTNGINACFKKGDIPHNKGKKLAEYCSEETIEKIKATQYKKGNKPLNTQPINKISIDEEGYKIIKVSDDGCRWKRWKYYQRYIWEQHYGKIPKGKIIIFLDGDKNNCNIENLAMIDRAEHKLLNQMHLRFNDDELTKTGINIVKLLEKIRKVKKCNLKN